VVTSRSPSATRPSRQSTSQNSSPAAEFYGPRFVMAAGIHIDNGLSTGQSTALRGTVKPPAHRRVRAFA